MNTQSRKQPATVVAGVDGKRERLSDCTAIILQQLGGSMFVVMTGASHFASGSRAISMQLPRSLTKNHVSHVKITLNGGDLYDLDAYAYPSPEPVESATDVFCEDLQEAFTEITGLKTHM